MNCGKVYDKLWNNYLAKYGDFRERLQTIQDDHQCFMQFQLPPLKQQSLHTFAQSSTSIKKSVFSKNDRKSRKCDPLLPPTCCGTSLRKNNLAFTLNQTDFDELQKLMQAENFPENIFSNDVQQRSSMSDGIELPMIDNALDDIHQFSSKQLTSTPKSVFIKNKTSRFLSRYDEKSSTHPLSNRTMQKSELDTLPQPASSSVDPTANRITNPYAQLIERLRRAENSRSSAIEHKSYDSKIDTHTQTRIQTFLSFLHSLDDTTDSKQNSNSLDEDTLLAIFSVDNHLSSSIYVPTNIHQLDIVPKTILHSLRNTSDNEQILRHIQAEISVEKLKESNSKTFKNYKPFINTAEQQHSKDEAVTSNFVDQDKELNSRLFNTYGVKVFKEFLIHRNRSVRLPKLFYDIDRWYQEYGMHKTDNRIN